jgi:hypothetical protein
LQAAASRQQLLLLLLLLLLSAVAVCCPAVTGAWLSCAKLCLSAHLL